MDAMDIEAWRMKARKAFVDVARNPTRRDDRDSTLDKLLEELSWKQQEIRNMIHREHDTALMIGRGLDLPKGSLGRAAAENLLRAYENGGMTVDSNEAG